MLFFLFTFHYVSINTGSWVQIPLCQLPLHSTMFLLILQAQQLKHTYRYALHSTMFLLILYQQKMRTALPWNFTFHYVSINTVLWLLLSVRCQSLHSTMFLLIPTTQQRNKGYITGFTFHYVSINTQDVQMILGHEDILYIPLCFY